MNLIKLFKNVKFQHSFIFFLSFLLSYYLFGPNLRAKWWIIDDHEIMLLLGQDGKVSISEIPKLLYNSPDKPFNLDNNTTRRFRPSYYFLRILEACLWGKTPSFWYLSRYLMASISIAIFFSLTCRCCGMLLGGVFTIYVISFPLWGDVWSRLGPSEAYAVFGTAIYCFGFFNLINHKTERHLKLNAFLLCIGAIIAIGSKENFLILIIPTIYLFINFIYRGRLNFPTVLSITIIFVFFVFVTVSLFVILRKSGFDVYDNSISLSSRTAILIKGFKKTPVILLIAISLIISVIPIILKKNNISLLKKKYFLASLSILTLVMLYISQFVFYYGKWPTKTRYDFPGIMYNPLFLIIIALIFFETVEKKWPSYKKSIHLFVVLIAIGISVLYFPAKLKSIRAVSINNLDRTINFTEMLENIVREAKINPENKIVLESHSIMDFEPVYSLSRFLFVYGVKNPLLLRLQYQSENNNFSVLQKRLFLNLKELSNKGSMDTNEGGLRFVPERKLKYESQSCYSIQLSGETIGKCRNLGKIYN